MKSVIQDFFVQELIKNEVEGLQTDHILSRFAKSGHFSGPTFEQ